MTVFDELMEMNNAYVEEFASQGLSHLPARALSVLTCMDARLHPEAALGIRLGDAHVIRNAGGRASDDAIRSIVVSQRMLGTREILLLHHTDCGMSSFTNVELAAKIETDLGVDVGEYDFLPFTDPAEGLRQDVETLVFSPLVAGGTLIIGAMYDVTTGTVSEVLRRTA